MGSKLTPLAVAALALLRERDMHPYEMYKLLISRRQDYLVKVRPGSLYHTVDRMEEAGLVAAIATDRQGNRPERTTYRLTSAGDAALRVAVAQHLHEPAMDYTWFPVAISEAHNLPAEQVLTCLADRLADLREQVKLIEAQAAAMAGKGLEPRYGLVVTYLQAVKQAEIDWIEGLCADIASGAIAWESTPALSG